MNRINENADTFVARANKWLNAPVVSDISIKHWCRAKQNELRTKKTIDKKTEKVTMQPERKKAQSFINIQKPVYRYLKVIPMTSVRNYESDKIAQLVASLHRNITSKVQFADNRINIELSAKVGYYIYMEKNKVEFYFIVPDLYKSLIKERISDTWKGITIIEVPDIPQFEKNAVAYKLDYKNEDALSLAADLRTNTLLSSMLSVLNVVEENDKIGVCYNFMPVGQYSWRANYLQTINKYKTNIPIEKEKMSATYIMKMAVHMILECLDITMESMSAVMGEVTDGKKKKLKLDDPVSAMFKMQKMNELSKETKQKRDAMILRTQAVVLSSSNTKHKALNNARSVCQSFKTITSDNEILYKSTVPPKSLTAYSLTGSTGMQMSPKECQNLLALPGYDLLDSFKCIEKIDTAESEVPPELRTGVMCLGTNTYRGVVQKAYLSTDTHLRNLSLVLIAPTRAGKSTLIANLAKDAINNRECTILFDFCGNCQLSDEVSGYVDNVLNINCDDFEKLQGIGYNEINSFPAKDPFMRYRNAKIQTSQLMTLVNGVNTADKELSAKMDRYLESAALIVFMVGGSTSDVFAVLQDHIIRNEYVKRIPTDQTENMKEYVYSLQSLNERDKQGDVVGTKYSLVAGIIDRVNKLKQNTYMELMFKKDSCNNINLCDEIQKNQLICLRMPEIMFTTETEKDSYCTYWATKIWLALQIRNWNLKNEHHTKVNIVVDELYQVPNTQEFIRSKLSQMAKFTGKMIISCHYLGQISVIRNELKAANSSYVLISGCDKDDFNELKNELKPFELEDMLNLKRYHAINLIKYENGYACFITKLPNKLDIKR